MSLWGIFISTFNSKSGVDFERRDDGRNEDDNDDDDETLMLFCIFTPPCCDLEGFGLSSNLRNFICISTPPTSPPVEQHFSVVVERNDDFG